MEFLTSVASASRAGRTLISVLDRSNLSTVQRDELAKSIVEFIKATGKEALIGKENSLKDSTATGKTKKGHKSLIEGVQLVAPRGKHDLLFFEEFFQIRSSKKETDISYSRIKHIAIIDQIPKDLKKRVLLYIDLAKGVESESKAVTEAIVIQVPQDAKLDIALPASPADRLSGPAAVVLCQAFGAMGLAPTAFVAPGAFKSSEGLCGIGATVRVDQGWLFPLPTAFCFLEKPVLWIDHEQIKAVEFARAGGSSHTFDLFLHTKDGRSLEFSSIDRSELGAVSSYVSRCGLCVGSADGDEQSGDEEMADAEDDSEEESQFRAVQETLTVLQDSDFDPEASSDEEAPRKRAGNDAVQGEESTGGSDASSEDSDSDSDISVVSDEGLSSSQIRGLVAEAKQKKKKK